MAFIDMTNQKFGKWVVIERDPDRTTAKGAVYWRCKCSCGNPSIISVLGTNLRNGRSSSCGKCQQYEVIGKRYGRLTILEVDNDYKIVNKIKNNHTYYKCRCSCEDKTVVTVQGNALFSGQTVSCGCLRREMSAATAKDLTGQVFGRLQALYPTDKRSGSTVIWHCKCLEDGNECEVRTSDLLNGHTQSCGCLKSIGESNIQKILKEHNIQFEREKTYEDLDHKKYGRCRYDFYLPEYNRLIEFDGEQHYKEVNFFDARSLVETQAVDAIKNQYALDNGISLVRIPYWERNKITLDMILGDEYLIKEEEV